MDVNVEVEHGSGEDNNGDEGDVMEDVAESLKKFMTGSGLHKNKKLVSPAEKAKLEQAKKNILDSLAAALLKEEALSGKGGENKNEKGVIPFIKLFWATNNCFILFF